MYLHWISSVKIGVLGQHSSTQLLQNLSIALPHVIKNIRENWDNVQSIHVKTSLSASLPIWSCRLDEEEGGRWDGLTRVPIPDDADEGVKKGKKRVLELEEETAKKKSCTPKTKSTSVPQAPGSSPSSTGSALPGELKPTFSATPIKAPKDKKERPAPESLKKLPTNEGPLKAKGKPVRATAVDFFDTDNLEDRRPLSKTSAYKTTAPRKSTESKPSPDAKLPAHKKPKSQGEKLSETKTILKSSKKIPESSSVGVQAKEKRVTFAVKPSELKTKKDKALGGLVGKKVRSGRGKGASAKDGVLGKKAAVR